MEDDLTIDIHGNVLPIRGQKRSGAEQEGRRYHLMEACGTGVGLSGRRAERRAIEISRTDS
jgi:hypothetical protein